MRILPFFIIAIMMGLQCMPRAGTEKIRIIAHRGASAYAPENTLAAFRKAKELGTGWFELDVYLSGDGIPVVLHDETVDRTTDGTGNITEKNIGEIKLLDAGSWFGPEFAGEKIPTLDEAVAFARDNINIYIEIKDANPDLPAKILECVKSHDMVKNVVIQSFSLEQLSIIRNLHKTIAIEYLVGDYMEIDLQRAASVGARSINPSFKELNADDVAQIHRLDLAVVPYTIDDPGDMERLLAMGVDGLITNKPDIALRMLSE